jgi:hypothetical protein
MPPPHKPLSGMPSKGEWITVRDSKDRSDEDRTGFEGATGFVDNVLKAFEGVGREHAKFAFIETSNLLPCNFCGEQTTFRLTVVRRGEENKLCMCDVCKQLIAES